MPHKLPEGLPAFTDLAHPLTKTLTTKNMTDPEGRKLIPARVQDPFRHKPVWAAYKSSRGSQYAEARSSEFLDLAVAKTTVDALNSKRATGEGYYFKVYRVAAPPPSSDK